MAAIDYEDARGGSYMTTVSSHHNSKTSATTRTPSNPSWSTSTVIFEKNVVTGQPLGPKSLRNKGYSPPHQSLLGYSSRPRRRACHRRHIFLSRTLSLGSPFKVLWTIVKDPTLTLAPSVGTSRSRNKKRRCR
ncbi:hypothetical protein PIB30_081374 [Stylosanthes scabra]|uniref:Uncharacterized protein n=1 Tax=Stylosanthes scabra TaxID=79078 RepID=A0ABU6XQJ2_9FABA|nr:hypothetical protein [Stylosanthes scabra]